jgi:hypothetical protein
MCDNDNFFATTLFFIVFFSAYQSFYHTSVILFLLVFMLLGHHYLQIPYLVHLQADACMYMNETYQKISISKFC